MNRLPSILAAAALVLLAATAVIRLAAVRDAATIGPGLAVTSGCEEETWLALWRAVNGMPVYTDSSRIPFTGAYFNWLFYTGYSQLLAPRVARLGDEALVHSGRLVTFSGAIVGMLGAATLLMRVTGGAGTGARLLGAALGAFVFFGPLAGWWSFTVRPDIWALALEALGCLVFLASRGRRPMAGALLAAWLFFAAWSFKQTFVTAPAATVLFLLLRRDWRGAMLHTAAFGLLCALAYGILGPVYRIALMETAQAGYYVASIGLDNARGAAVKLLPLIVAIPAVVIAWRRPGTVSRGGDPARDALLLGTLGAVAGLLVSLPASAKFGASVNYYFSPSLFLAIAAAAGIAITRSLATASAVAAAMVLLAAAPLTGRFGRIDLSAQSGILATRWELWRGQPGPRYSSDLRLNLPWLGQEGPAFVLAYDYHGDRRRGREFEAGGIGGLIESGYFTSLLLPAETDASYDSGSLVRYERIAEREGMALYRRR